MKNNGKILLTATISAIVASIATGTIFIATNTYNQNTNEEDFSDYYEVINYIDQYYYKEPDKESYMDNALKGLVAGLGDPYAIYMTPDEYQSQMESYEGSFAGIGVTITQNEDKEFEIVEVLKDSPALENGIEVGDIITSVNDIKTDHLTNQELVTLVKGPVGTQVTITFKRDGKEFDKTLTRDEIKSETVEYQMLENNTAYIKVTSFKDVTTDQFKIALDSALNDGAEKIIYDLRNNGGGLLTSCQAMLDLLLPEGDVAYAKFKDGSETVICSSDKKELNLPTVILVNENTASASELFSSAMRDFDKAQLVGTKTYGKGIMQNTIGLSNNGGLTITVAEYRTAKSECFHGEGLQPDYEVELPEGTDISSPDPEKDPQLKKAMEILK